MAVEYWWNDLTPWAQEWIAGHLGEVLPPDVAAEVSVAGGRMHKTIFLGTGPVAYQLRQRDAREIRQGLRSAA